MIRHSMPAMIRMMSRDSLWSTIMMMPSTTRKIPEIRESFHGLNFSMVTSIGVTEPSYPPTGT